METMLFARNPALANLKAGYLFPEINRRRDVFARQHPGERIISLGVGNTTEHIPQHILAGLADGVNRMGDNATYSGYMERGFLALRKKISEVFYHGRFDPDEVFISDGAKCDIGRLQLLFGRGVKVAMQDPSYPVYVDGSVLIGAAGRPLEQGYEGITYLPCTADNGFFPDLSLLPEGSVFYFCSPNNPTGMSATHEQFAALVEAARRTHSLVVCDAAYAEYIRDPTLPKSIFDVAGADEVAIEVNSLSKSAGFTGVRLGWTVVPKKLRYAGGESLHADWSRVTSTIFNGASNIVQYGAIAALSDEGQVEMRRLTDYYMGNAALIRSALERLGITCEGGYNSPYIWANFPGEDSWDVFARILEQYRIVTTPGGGFGPAGTSFIRFSGYGHREDVEEACRRLAAKNH